MAKSQQLLLLHIVRMNKKKFFRINKVFMIIKITEVA